MTASETTPKCHHCGNLNCVSCVAREYLTKITAVHVQLPEITAEQRQRDRERAPGVTLNLALYEALMELATRALRLMTTGRWELCAEHTVHADPIAAFAALDEATAALGGRPAKLASTLLREDPAVMRHTLQRFARLWSEVREGLDAAETALREAAEPARAVHRELDALGSVSIELDELARGVLS